MSVEAVNRKGGRVWRVRWNDSHGKPRSRVLGRKRDAELYDAEIKRRKRLGTLVEMEQGTEPLAEFVKVWWDRYAVPNLERRTRDAYVGLWDNYVAPYLGDVPLRSISTETLSAWIAELRAEKVGEPTIAKSKAILSGVLQRAMEWGKISSNPARLVSVPQPRRVLAVKPIADEEIAKLVDASDERVRLTAAFMGYAGLRPSELRALTWEDISENTILVDKSVNADGSIKTTKNHRIRTVTIRPELRRFIMRNRGEGDIWVWSKSDKSWTRFLQNHWNQLVEFRPYDLRHTFVSKLIEEGRSVVDVARQAGHDPNVCLGTYAHVFEDRRQDAA